MPVERHERLVTEGILERIVKEEGLTVLGWRDTPIDGTPSDASPAPRSLISSRSSSATNRP
jgi:glutamate synthase domain-containing protein 1